MRSAGRIGGAGGEFLASQSRRFDAGGDDDGRVAPLVFGVAVGQRQVFVERGNKTAQGRTAVRQRNFRLFQRAFCRFLHREIFHGVVAEGGYVGGVDVSRWLVRMLLLVFLVVALGQESGIRGAGGTRHGSRTLLGVRGVGGGLVKKSSV